MVHAYSPGTWNAEAKGTLRPKTSLSNTVKHYLKNTTRIDTGKQQERVQMGRGVGKGAGRKGKRLKIKNGWEKMEAKLL